MKKTIFEGVATAIVTPLNENGIDWESFGRLVEWQIDEGVNAIVVCGTTGESSTLTDEEHKAAIKFVIDKVNKRVPVIAGTGSNDTAYAIELSKHACEIGADALLLVTPYYNKATQKGLITHYTAIADSVDKPIILYNVPSRTGVNILPETCLELSKHENIVAVKEASGNISQVAKLASLVGDKMDIYSGNDDQIIPIMSLGGKGVISVVSNIMPKETADMCRLYREGSGKEALKLQLEMLDLINALFSEVNPIPVKAATSAMGFGENFLRLPLTPMEECHKKVLFDEMKKHKLI